MTPLSMVCHYYSQSRVVLYCKTRSFGLIWCGKPDSPLVHVMFCVVQPHPNLDGVALPDPMEDVLHLVLAVHVLPDLVVVLVGVEVEDGQVLRRQVLPAAPHPTALRPTHYFPLTSPKSPSSSSFFSTSCLFPLLIPLSLLPHPLPVHVCLFFQCLL